MAQNLSRLKTEYVAGRVSGKWNTLKEFCDLKGLNYQSIKQTAAEKKWNEEAKRKTEEKNAAVVKLTAERVTRAEVNRNTRHLELWDRFMDMVENAITDPKTFIAAGGKNAMSKTLKEFGETLERIQKGQRLAMGLDKAGGGDDDNEPKSLEVVFTNADDGKRVNSIEEGIKRGGDTDS